ncbi:uncharacterized protein ASPGLDRAFT_52326 [Aspergillus glaucus CBS 516.65]|uniref:GPI anchored cell wall protein n=1 Tax=Aspergillus glaucus CBS 516.65 TaxID=1160497 RepID=A0A1L9V798_ASPGL|nr:hypothetical protein ASPGLDRAFT_52326 [Aspergillus glaucus CBS 516.65]OJJ79793.1 hypothetical protein ASPGLDRAFT_52326 [Aspergillus glaucus CBS 516.65]
MKSYIPILALATTALSQTTTLKVFDAGESALPLTDIAASVVKVNALETILALNCAPNATASVCPLETPFTLTYGPSTATLNAAYATNTRGVQAKMSLLEGCDIVSSTQGASCSMSMVVGMSVRGVSTSTTTSTTTSYGSEDITYRDLAVTAGVSKLTAPEATQTPEGGAVPGAVVNGKGIGGLAAAAVAAAAMFV